MQEKTALFLLEDLMLEAKVSGDPVSGS